MQNKNKIAQIRSRPKKRKPNPTFEKQPAMPVIQEAPLETEPDDQTNQNQAKLMQNTYHEAIAQQPALPLKSNQEDEHPQEL